MCNIQITSTNNQSNAAPIHSNNKINDINLNYSSTFNSNQIDKIEISNEGKNLTKTQTISMVLDGTLDEFKNVHFKSGDGMIDPLVNIVSIMIDKDIHPLPEDLLNPKNPSSLADFAAQLKNVASKNLDLVPPEFMDFCDKLKENSTKSELTSNKNQKY